MKRRQFLKTAAGAAAAGTAFSAAPAIAQQKFKWKMVTCWPKNFPALGTGAQRLCDIVDEMSDGRLTIKLFAAGELVPAFEVFDYVREGRAECGHGAPYYWIAKHSATPFFCTVPGGLTAYEHTAWITTGGGQELWDELYDEFGLRAFLAGNGGPNLGGWFRKEINAVSDFQGLKMRIPGLGGEVLARMGATTVNLPAAELLPALQTGALDASEWAGPYMDLALGFYKVAQYYYGPGMHEPGPANSLIMNKEAYEELPKDLQAIVRSAAAQTSSLVQAEVTTYNAESLEALLDKHGVQLRSFPQEVVDAMFESANAVIAETAAKTEIGGRIFASWETFRQRMIASGRIGDHGFMEMRAQG